LGGCPGLLETILQCILSLPQRMPDSKRFDLLLCALVFCPLNVICFVFLFSRLSVTISFKQLFLTREEQARNHDFERDDDDDEAARRRREQLEASSALPNSAVEQARFGRPTHIEEAGLKWRLIEDRKATGFVPTGGIMGRKWRTKSRRSRRRFNPGMMDEYDDESAVRRRGGENEDDDDDEEDEAPSEGSNDSEEDEDDECEEDDDDDESVGSGADVEFVADTQEEQERLAERMCQAQRHMEDSVVAAYAGCILQSSPRYADRIRSKLPDGQFRPLAIMLAKLLSFLSLTKGVGSSGSESILRIVRVLEAQDKTPVATTTNGEATSTTRPTKMN
uniref:WAPL domain-containing protein n=1 Tax=Echinostoma caproni TaxID=27848 RepID=A0A183AN89_9TREM